MTRLVCDKEHFSASLPHPGSPWLWGAAHRRRLRLYTVCSICASVAKTHVQVDLAGSERTKVSQAEGMQMKEACNGLWHPTASQRAMGHGSAVPQANCINRSLSALSDVLSALGDSSGNERPSEVLSRRSACRVPVLQGTYPLQELQANVLDQVFLNGC